jgi:ethanolamine-phosphate cytidylyltransferase
MLSACKFVDEIIENVPYTTMTPGLLDKLGVDFAAHGDDMPILPDGTKMYGPVEAAGRYLVFKRSEGISTTNLLNRLLLATKTHDSPVVEAPRNNLNNFILSSQRLSQFSNHPNKRIEHARNIVYIDGDFDFFHMGHVEILKSAKAQGDFLIVGLHSDIDIQAYRSRRLNLGIGAPQMFSVMNVGERAINLLSCKYVDDVILDAPLIPTADFFGALSIRKMCVVDNHVDFLNDLGRVKVARDWEMLEVLKVGNDLFSTKSLLFRFLSAREEFVRRNHVKKDPTVLPVLGCQ